MQKFYQRLKENQKERARCAFLVLYFGVLAVLVAGAAAPLMPWLLSFAAGAMLYVVFGEIMPESYLIYRSKLPAFAVMVGLALGMFMIFF